MAEADKDVVSRSFKMITGFPNAKILMSLGDANTPTDNIKELSERLSRVANISAVGLNR